MSKLLADPSSASIFIAGSAVLLPVLASLAVIDARTSRLPDVLTLPLVFAGLGWHWAFAQPLGPAMLGAGIGYGAFAVFGWIFFRMRKVEGLGLGDAKLFAAAGAWLGAAALPFVALLAAVAALIFAVLSGTRRVAFGPWLAAATAAVWLTGAPWRQ